MSGLVSRHDKDWLVVSTTGKHMLLVEKIINESGENIISKIKSGDRFFTPQDKIDSSNRNKVVFTSKGKKS